MEKVSFTRVFAPAILGCFLLTLVLTTPVLAAPLISVSPSSGSTGTKVTITGEDFFSYKGDDLYVILGDQAIASTLTVPQTGSFSFDFIIPAGVAPGRHEVRVDGQLGTLALAWFTVLKPEIALNSNAGVTGTDLNINGHGFYADRALSFYYDDQMLGTQLAENTGEFHHSFQIPESIAGKHKIIARNTEGHSAEAEFKVLPSISLNVTSSSAGSILAVSGSGYGSVSSITVYFGHDEIAFARTNETGSFKATLLRVPEKAPGTYDVAATDTYGNTSKATFTLVTTAISSDKADNAVSHNWTTYTFIGAGVLVVGLLAFWIGRKTTYWYK